jgi:hypothetical protein
MLCLWHVRKAWTENVVRKISDPILRVEVLKGIAQVMYTTDGNKGNNTVAQAQQKFDDLKLQFPQALEFFVYFEKQWMPKMCMWVIGFRNVPHAGQDTNAAVESYHANMKSIMSEARQKFQGRRMDWLIYELTGDVHTHYWYAVQCKLYGFIANRNAEHIVASTVLWARGIPDHLVWLFPGGQDIAQVMSINHYSEVYTILAPG